MSAQERVLAWILDPNFEDVARIVQLARTSDGQVWLDMATSLGEILKALIISRRLLSSAEVSAVIIAISEAEDEIPYQQLVYPDALAYGVHGVVHFVHHARIVIGHNKLQRKFNRSQKYEVS